MTSATGLPQMRTLHLFRTFLFRFLLPLVITTSSAAAQTTAPNEWTWVGGHSTVTPGTQGWPGVYGTIGISAATNIPGSRQSAVSWTDKYGNFWLFGGWGFDASSNLGSLNDLW